MSMAKGLWQWEDGGNDTVEAHRLALDESAEILLTQPGRGGQAK